MTETPHLFRSSSVRILHCLHLDWDPHYTSHCLLSLPLSHRCLLSPLLHLLMIWSCCDSPPTPLTAVLSACYHHEAAAWQGRELSQLETLTCARQNSLPPSVPPALPPPSPQTDRDLRRIPTCCSDSAGLLI